MKNNNFGVVNEPNTVSEGTATYSVPRKISKEDSTNFHLLVSNDFSIQNNISKDEEDDDEVTHGVFFGENIKRVMKAFKK